MLAAFLMMPCAVTRAQQSAPLSSDELRTMLRDALDRERLWQARSETAEALAEARRQEAESATRLAEGERALREKAEGLLAKSEEVSAKALAAVDKFEAANKALAESVAVRDRRITELEVKLKAAHRRTIVGTVGGVVAGVLLKALVF
jgi:molecular chaperone DnaK (HSP70)